MLPVHPSEAEDVTAKQDSKADREAAAANAELAELLSIGSESEESADDSEGAEPAQAMAA